jgi:uncharacterized protein
MSDVVRKLLKNFREAVDHSEDLGSGQKARLLDQVESAVRDEPIPTLLIIGESGVGKSTTINALFNAGEEVGHTRATTKTAVGIDVYVDRVRGARGELRVFDMPGLGDHQRNYTQYVQLYQEILPFADAILWVHPATDRSIQFAQQSMADIFRPLPQLLDKVVFGLNKGDEIYPHDWNPVVNLPSAAQEATLKERTHDFSQNMRYAFQRLAPPVVAYSALKRYNLATLFKALMRAVPTERRWVLESRMDLANFLDLVDKGLVEAAERHLHTSPQPAERQPATSTPFAPSRRDPDGTHPLPAKFEEYLAGLPEKEYIALVSDRPRLLQVMRDWGVGK